MVDLRKELEKFKEKQDKINYLQELLKKTKDNKLKEEILDLLDELLEEESLEEVIEPVKIEHGVLEEVRRENPIEPVRAQEPLSFRASDFAESGGREENLRYERRENRDNLTSLYNNSQFTELIRRADFNDRRILLNRLRYVSQTGTDQMFLDNLEKSTNLAKGESVEEYIRPQDIERDFSIREPSIENLFKEEKDRKYIKRSKEKTGW